MTDIVLQRALEIKFYFFCQELYKLRPDVQTLVGLVDCIAEYNNDIDKPVLKDIILNILSGTIRQPNQLETIAVLYQSGMPVAKTLVWANINGKRFYEKLAQFKEDPFPIFTKHNPYERTQMQNFLDTYQTIFKIGGKL